MASPFKSSFLMRVVFFYFHCYIPWPTNPFKTIVLTPSIQGCARRLETETICQVHDILHNRNSISFSDHFHPSKVHPLKSDLLPRQVTHIITHFLLTVHFYGMQFLATS